MIDRELAAYLQEVKLLDPGPVSIRPLTGGVSSDIVVVEQGDRAFVVKQALAKLNVADDWFADVGRNRVECQALEYCAGVMPTAVPRLLHADPDVPLFVMEYLGQECVAWKTPLVEGDIQPAIASSSAEVLAQLHIHSWGKEDLRRQFDTRDNFRALRIEPYLLTTGRRNPDLDAQFREEAERLYNSEQALVHGDYSPKNILVSSTRIVIIDWEVAWFGDPAFDAAFLLCHLYLNAFYHRRRFGDDILLAQTARTTYLDALGQERAAPVRERVARLLLMLLLARIDGKSPVEYITQEGDKTLLRSFAAGMLAEGCLDFEDIDRSYKKLLEKG